jgi:hypothetical protein
MNYFVMVSNFEILNSLGQTVFNGSLLERTVMQTENLYPGIYMLKFGTDNNMEFKIIIKK